MYRDDKSKTGWRVTPNFSIHIHIKDITLLESIRDTLGVGKVRKNSTSTAVFRVDNIQELQAPKVRLLIILQNIHLLDLRFRIFYCSNNVTI